MKECPSSTRSALICLAKRPSLGAGNYTIVNPYVSLTQNWALPISSMAPRGCSVSFMQKLVHRVMLAISLFPAKKTSSGFDHAPISCGSLY